MVINEKSSSAITPKTEIFTLSLGGKDIMFQSMSEADSLVSIIGLEANQDSSKSDKEIIIGKIAKSGAKTPIFNIQFLSNEKHPIISSEELKGYKNLGVKISFTFENYKSLSKDKDLEGQWKELLKHVDHVFFANAEDQDMAVSNKFIAEEKTSNFQTEKNPYSVMYKILQIPMNVTLDSILPEDITNLIAAKFSINHPDQLFGIKLEVEDILKKQNNSFKNLEEYVSQISKQFQNDSVENKINPISINFVLPKSLEQTLNPSIAQNIQNKQIKDSSKSLVKVLDYFKKIVNKFNERIVKPNIQAQFNLAKTTIELPKQDNQSLLIDLIPEDMHNIKNPIYLYEDHIIYNILQASLDRKKVYIQPAISLKNEAMVTDTLREAMSQVKNGKEIAVIPIETGGDHWVGITITYDKNDKQVIFTYNDPKGNPIDYRPDLIRLIGKVAPNAITIDLKTSQQQNESDCGVFVCDNLIKLSQGKEILDERQSQDAGTLLRKQHVKCLSNIFATQKQAKEIGNNMYASVNGRILRHNKNNSTDKKRGL